MLTFLAIVTAAVITGQEAPEILAPFKDTQSCLVQAAKLNHVNADKLREHGAIFVCLKVEVPHV